MDAAPQVLPPFGAKLGKAAQESLEKRGVEVLLGAMVTNVDERGIELQYKDGTATRIESATKIWAAGVQASPLGRMLAEQTGAQLDRAGRISVNPNLTLPGYPEVFVIGDMMALDNLPGVAQVAIQGGKYAAKVIDRRVEEKTPPEAFKYFDKGSMATISRFSAVALVGKLRLTGIIAWLMWLVIHLLYLTGFKNRFTALLHWLVTFISNSRSERTATAQQIYARRAISRLEGGTASVASSPTQWNDVRAELEARAAEETRLADSGERGTKVEAGQAT